MNVLDPRLNPYRPDLASSALRGRVEAARFVEARPAVVTSGVADLRRRPAPTAPLDTQLLFGERVGVYERDKGWAWVQNAADGYVGYVEDSHLHDPPPASEASHYLKVLRSFVYPEPDLKTRPVACLSFMSPVRTVGARAGYSEIALPGGGGWVYTAHLAETGESQPDYVASAQMFLGVPYLWGGRSSLGLDCSALVQLALARAGVPCPRDSGMQAKCLGHPLEWRAGETRLRRGDLVYFPGHCAIALNDTEVLHSNAGAMLTAVEPLADVVLRVEAESGGRGITGVRRVAA